MGKSWQDPEKGQNVAEGVPSCYYGTFQGQPSYPQSLSPSAPPSYPDPVPPSYAPTDCRGGDDRYQSVRRARDRFLEGRPLLGGEIYERSDRLPFCNLGFGWFLFIIGFFIVIPWYIGAIFLFCLAHDYRERAGLVACTIAAVIVLFAGGSRAGFGR